MKTECNLERLNRMLDDFSIATGINVNFASPDRTVLRSGKAVCTPYCQRVQSTREGEARCTASDHSLLLRCDESRCRERHICHAGLTDVAVPLYHDSQLLGYLLLGQMKTKAEFEGEDSLRELYNALPLYTEEQIHAICSVAEMMARYVLLENVLTPSYRRGVEEAIAFIDGHLSEPLTVHTIAKSTYVSKTTLYDAFRRQLGCTVNEYVSHRRLEASLPLLLHTAKSVEAIAQEVGFSGAAYYSRLFKERYGIPPLRYRKSHKG